jgi:hypothetical protein
MVRNCRLDDHRSLRINLQYEIDHILDMMSIKEILLRIIISRSCNNHKLSILISRCAIKRCSQIQFLLSEKLLDIFILNRTDSVIDLFNLFRYHIHSRNAMMLSQQSGH